MTELDYKAPGSIGRLQQRALVAGVIGVVLCIVGFFRSPDQFFQSYLVAFLFVLGLSLGSLGLVMLQHMTGGDWGIVIRRPLESAAHNLWLVVILFVPIILGMKHIYVAWLNAPLSGESALSDFQKRYLTSSAFITRAIIYFGVWLALMLILDRWSKQQDINREDRRIRRDMKMLSGPGILLYVFGMGFASIDWVMSISPHWFSTIYGFIFVAGQTISALSLVICIVILLAQTAPMAGLIQQRHLHDLGKLLLTFVMLWAYFCFSQLLIIWSGNQPEEISFYYSRLNGGWGVVAVIILIFHFFVPFLLLLSRDVKRNPKLLPLVCLALIFMRLVDLFWTTRPEFTSNAVPSWLDIAAPLALGGLWLAFFARNIQSQPLLPLGDPKLEEAIAHHEH